MIPQFIRQNLSLMYIILFAKFPKFWICQFELLGINTGFYGIQ